MKFRIFDIIQGMENVWNMGWKKFSMEWNGMKDFDKYVIWKFPIPLHSISCPACHNCNMQ